ncbi:MAG: alpha/beta hydrolase [Gemmataceae bacterium]
MLVDLVQTTTQDGIRLDGIYQESEAAESPLKLDAVVCLHGTGSNFYGSTLFEFLSGKFLKIGVSVLRVNTRGHDGISTAATARGGLRQGAAFEVIDDCRADIRAWVNWLAQSQCERVLLVGHSMGALKSLYTVANEKDLSVAGVVAISPPRLSCSWFLENEKTGVFRETLQQSQQLVAADEAQHVMTVTFPLPIVITAGGYVEKYGPEERYNFLNFLADVQPPTLLTFGSIEVENNVAFQDSPNVIKHLSPRPKKTTVETILAGDHMYTAVRDELWESMEKWLRATFG